MAIFQVKPSRGVVVFFVMLVVGVGVKIGFKRHVDSAVARDMGVTNLTRKALRCLAGSDIQRVLDARPGQRNIATWKEAIHDRLYQISTAMPPTHTVTDWPGRCVPLFDDVERSLSSRTGAQGTTGDGHLVAAELRSLALSHTRWINAIEHTEFAHKVAALAFNVSQLSVGTREAWDSRLDPAPTDLDPVPAMRVPQPVSFSNAPTRTMFLFPDLVAWQGLDDGMLHLTTFDTTEHVKSDRVVGHGVPVRSEGTRPWIALASRDDGETLLLPGGQPANVVPMPETIRNGTERRDTWDAMLTEHWLWLAVTDRGTTRVHRMPRSGGAWEAMTLDRSDVPTLAAMIVPRVAADGVDLLEFKQTPHGYNIVRDVLAAGASEVVERSSHREPDVEAFAPVILSCVSDAARFALTLTEGRMVAHTWNATGYHTQQLRHAFEEDSVGRQISLSCTSSRLLVAVKGPSFTLFSFDFLSNEGAHVTMPVIDRESHPVFEAAGLTKSHGAVLVVRDDFSVRTWYETSASDDSDPTADSSVWSVGGLIGLPTGHQHTNYHGATIQRVGAMSAEGDQVAVLVEAVLANEHFVGRLSSRDGGLSFTGD